MCSLEAMNDGDIVLMKMLVHCASIIYCYKTIDLVKTFLQINIGLKFSAVRFHVIIFLDANALSQVPYLIKST